MTETMPRFDIPRLDRAIEGITLSPETWNQGTWRCATGMCIAGHIVEQNGDTWATGAGRPGSDFVIVPVGTDGAFPHEDALNWAQAYEIELPEGMTLISASLRANSLLGLSDAAHSLFNGSNTLAGIKEYRDQMARGEVPLAEYDEDDDDEYDA